MSPGSWGICLEKWRDNKYATEKERRGVYSKPKKLFICWLLLHQSAHNLINKLGNFLRILTNQVLILDSKLQKKSNDLVEND